MREHDEPLDQATADRLAKLASMPVDLSRLEERLADTLPPRQQPTPQPALRPTHGWLRLAAAITLLLGVSAASYFAFFGTGPQVAMAQTMTVAQLHEHLLDDPQQTYLATTLAQAQALIDAQLADNQPLALIENIRVESCCLVDSEFPLRAALVVQQPASQVTIIIAQGKDFAYPMQPIDHPSGIKLQGHEHAGVPMVMRNTGDLWMCVMGQMPLSELAEIAAGIDF